jgi:hypothetical protein
MESGNWISKWFAGGIPRGALDEALDPEPAGTSTFSTSHV